MGIPSPTNDYVVPLEMDLSRQVWDAVFASVGARIRALEGTTADYNAAIAQLETQALAVISATITDEINARRADLEALEAEIAAVSPTPLTITRTATGATGAGVAVCLRSDGTISAASDIALLPDFANFIGITEAAIADAAVGGVTVKGGVNAQQTGLVPGEHYYLQANGTIATTPSNSPVGFALSATEMFVTSGGRVGSGRNFSISTSDPTGGSHGDIWFKVA